MKKTTATSNTSAGSGDGGGSGARIEGSNRGGASTSTGSGTNGGGNSASTSGSTILTAAVLQMLSGTMDTALLTKLKIVVIIALHLVKLYCQKSQASQIDLDKIKITNLLFFLFDENRITVKLS